MSDIAHGKFVDIKIWTAGYQLLVESLELAPSECIFTKFS